MCTEFCCIYYVSVDGLFVSSNSDTDCDGPQFSAEHGILSRTMEFAHFCRIFVFVEFCLIQYWPGCRGQDIGIEFWWPYYMCA